MNPRAYQLLVFVILSWVLAAVKAAETEAPEPSTKKTEGAAASSPHIEFERLLHDFGDVAPDSVSYCTFTFKNTGTGTLHIAEVTATCTCTTPDVGEKKDYAPGESGEIRVRLHAYNHTGTIAQGIFVSSNDSSRPEAELAIRAEVPAAVRITPKVLIFSSINSTEAKNAGADGMVVLDTAITLASADHKPFAITGFSSVGDLFTIDFDPKKQADTHTLYPKVNLGLLNKYPDGYLVFTVNHPSCKSLQVEYNSSKEFEVTPGVLVFRNAVAGEVQKQTLQLVCKYRLPVEIETVTSDKNIASMVSQKSNGYGLDFDIQVVPPPKTGPGRVFSDILHVKIKGKEPIDVPCRGFYKAGS